MTVFVDTGYYVATILRRDHWAKLAKEAAQKPISAVTSSLVINETIAFLQARGFVSAALSFLTEARGGTLGQIIQVDALIQAEAWRLFHRWAGSGATPVDCSSFAIMERLGIKKAFAFDLHFKAAGFEILR